MLCHPIETPRNCTGLPVESTRWVPLTDSRPYRSTGEAASLAESQTEAVQQFPLWLLHDEKAVNIRTEQGTNVLNSKFMIRLE